MTIQLIEPLHTAERASQLAQVTAPSAFLEFMSAGKHPVTCTYVWTLASLFAWLFHAPPGSLPLLLSTSLCAPACALLYFHFVLVANQFVLVAACTNLHVLAYPIMRRNITEAEEFNPLILTITLSVDVLIFEAISSLMTLHRWCVFLLKCVFKLIPLMGGNIDYETT